VGTVVVLGEPIRTDGFGLAGAVVRHATDRDAVVAACSSLPDDVAVVVLTPAAAAHGARALLPERVLSVVMPP
jgi:vacuolar-type H+-ATPase subunit F/Vma7